MGIDGRGKLTKDIKVRTRLEFAINPGDAHGGEQFSNAPGGSDFDIRHLDVIFSHKKAGAIWVGRGDTATNGTSEVNLAPGIGTGRLGGSVHHAINEFRLMDEDDSLATQSVGTVNRFFNNFDGAGRANRIRYDSPTFFGFKASASIIDKHNFDAALRYSGKVAGTKIKGAVGFCETKGASNQNDGTCFGNGASIEGVANVNGSISVLTPIGIGGAFSGAKRWQNRAGAAHAIEGDPYNIVPSIFYTAKVTELGATTAEYAFQYCKHCGLKDDKGIGHAVTIGQKVDSTGGDYFVTFRLVDVETATNDDIENLWFIGAGFRQRF
jgi:predicted porin